jgi:hypothetical protein
MALQEKNANAGAATTHVPAPVIDWSRHTASLTDENAPAQTKKSAAAKAPASNKRKSDAQDDDIKSIMFPEGVEYLDDEDSRLQPTDSDTCGKIRQKIRR